MLRQRLYPQFSNLDYYSVESVLSVKTIGELSTSLSKDIRTVKPDFYAVPPQNIFEISPGFQLAM